MRVGATQAIANSKYHLYYKNSADVLDNQNNMLTIVILSSPRIFPDNVLFVNCTEHFVTH